MPTFRHDGLDFDYLDEGDGHPVVLLHGFPEDARSWDAVARRLHDAGLRTLALEQRGYSPGAAPRGRGEYRLRHLSGDVVALLDAVGLEKATVVGHDWGGGVAWDVAARSPERVTSLVSLSTPHPSAMAWAYARSSQFLRSGYMVFFQLPWLPERVVAGALERGLRRSGLNPDAARRYASRFHAPRSLTGPLNWYRGIPLSREVGVRGPDPIVRVPTTYVWGRRDAYLGPAAARKTADFVAADYRFVDLDATHWLPEDAPAEVAAAIIGRVGTADGPPR